MTHTRSISRTRKPYRQRMKIEQLELRTMLDAAGGLLTWTDETQLTVSFAPDGTQIADHPSSLHSTMGAVAGAEDWQDAILSGFQAWAINAVIDFGVVSDDGSPFGVSGPRHADPRFGDIRIGARPLGDDVFAISVSEATLVSGTWAGDLVFNSNAEFRSTADIYAATLHEVGHLLGLSHTDNPSSPMFSHGIPESTMLTDTDIAQVQQLHGSRTEDANEIGKGNATIRKATGLRIGMAFPGERGTAPSMVFGDISTVDDVDTYSLDVPNDYSGAVSIRVVTDGISLLRPTLNVLDSDGALLHSSVPSAGQSVTDAHVRLGDGEWDEKVFIQVRSDAESPRNMGRYTLIATFDDRLAVDAEFIDQIAKSRQRDWSQQQLTEFFAIEHPQDVRPNGGPFWNNDHHSDDEMENAFIVTTKGGFESFTRYEVVGSVSDASDRDRFRIHSPRSDSTSLFMTATVRSVDRGALIPRLSVSDQQGNPAEATTLVNGGGEIVIQLPVQPNKNYFITVQPQAAVTPFVTGNYRLGVSFGDAATELTTFATGQLAPNESVSTLLHIAESQLVHFILTADEVNESGGELAVVAEIHDDRGEAVQRLITSPGESRSAPSILLRPGQYQVHLSSVALNSQESVGFHLSGSALSDPLGIDPVDTTETPVYQCHSSTSTYCYPDGSQTTEPMNWEELLAALPDFPVYDPEVVLSSQLSAWWQWYLSYSDSNETAGTTPDAYSLESDSTLTIGRELGVLSNDAEYEQQPLSAVVVEGPQHGLLQFHADGSFTYDPDEGYVGEDVFYYVARDPNADSVPTIVTLSITQRPVEGDLDSSGMVDIRDMDLLRDAIAEGDLIADLNSDGIASEADIRYMANSILNTSIGDANLDGVFDRLDLVAVLQTDEYDDDESRNSSWATGDWNGDGDFDRFDLIYALQWGNYQP